MEPLRLLVPELEMSCELPLPASPLITFLMDPLENTLEILEYGVAPDPDTVAVDANAAGSSSPPAEEKGSEPSAGVWPCCSRRPSSPLDRIISRVKNGFGIGARPALVPILNPAKSSSSSRRPPSIDRMRSDGSVTVYGVAAARRTEPVAKTDPG